MPCELIQQCFVEKLKRQEFYYPLCLLIVLNLQKNENLNVRTREDYLDQILESATQKLQTTFTNFDVFSAVNFVLQLLDLMKSLQVRQTHKFNQLLDRILEIDKSILSSATRVLILEATLRFQEESFQLQNNSQLYGFLDRKLIGASDADYAVRLYFSQQTPRILKLFVDPESQFAAMHKTLLSTISIDIKTPQKRAFVISSLHNLGSLAIANPKQEHLIFYDLCVFLHCCHNDRDMFHLLTRAYFAIAKQLGYYSAHNNFLPGPNLEIMSKNESFEYLTASKGTGRLGPLHEHMQFLVLEWLRPTPPECGLVKKILKLEDFPWELLFNLTGIASAQPASGSVKREAESCIAALYCNEYRVLRKMEHFSDFLLQYQSIVVPALVIAINFEDIKNKLREAELENVALILRSSIEDLLDNHYSRIAALSCAFANLDGKNTNRGDQILNYVDNIVKNQHPVNELEDILFLADYAIMENTKLIPASLRPAEKFRASLEKYIPDVKISPELLFTLVSHIQHTLQYQFRFQRCQQIFELLKYICSEWAGSLLSLPGIFRMITGNM